MENPAINARRLLVEASLQCAEQADLLERLEIEGAPPEALEAASFKLADLDRNLAALQVEMRRQEKVEAVDAASVVVEIAEDISALDTK
jgi:hypothetical protein